MPPRLEPPSGAIRSVLRTKHLPSNLFPRQYATAVAAIAPSPSIKPTLSTPSPAVHRPTTQPQSHKRAEYRKTQLLRQYASLLQSAPLTLLFQHNNIKSNEWMSIRRELSKALQKVDAARAVDGQPYENVASGIKIQIIQTGIFAAALRIVEHYTPEQKAADSSANALTHVLSEAVHSAVVDKKSELAPLLSGPLVLLTFPTVSPQYLAAALSILAPSAPRFPAPTRKGNPGWHDNAVQTGLQKLLLLGARVDGKVFDVEGTRWVGGIEGGLDGLRGHLVAMLQSMGAGITNTLESASKNLYFTVESRRTMMEDEAKGPSEGEVPQDAPEK